MNYYNPYFWNYPNMINTATRTGIFSRLFGGLTFSKFIDGTQRTLSFANQAIPFVKQVKPLIGNAKTMLKVMNEFKRYEKPKTEYTKNESNTNFYNNESPSKNTNGPNFFI